jgi:DNA replication protein DnaC
VSGARRRNRATSTRRDPGARFQAVSKLLDSFPYDHGAQQRDSDIMAELVGVALLVLDDLGAERNTDWATERLFALLNERHDYRRRTIVTSNPPPSELANHIGGRTMWRIAELASGYIVSLDGCPNLRAHLHVASA